MKKLLLAYLLLVLVSACKESAKEQVTAEVISKQPNIIFIMSDDHAYQAISAYDHPVSKLAPTPNIDRIAENGMRMDRAYVTNSICGPSRAVILTGKHSHINGFRQNGDRFNGDQPTLPKKLKELGYTTSILGKWHLDGYPQGFDYWNIIQDQGNYYNPNFIKDGDTTQVEGYATDIITADAIKWLDKQRDTSKPFFMMVHHKAPHRNWMPALRHVNKYDSVTFPLPETYFADNKGQQAAQEQLQTIYTDMYEGHDLKMTKTQGNPQLAHNPWTTDFDRMTPQQRKTWDAAYQPKNDAFHKANLHGEELAVWKGQRYLQDYMATIAAVDEGVGSILDYLEANNLDKNTIVVYTSDQGFYLGEKGFFDKRFMYEESYRTPLLIQYPNSIKAGTTSDALVQNLDFAQTFLDYANGTNLTKDMQGQSLRPVLEQKIGEADFRSVLYYHYYDFPAFHMVKKHYGVSTKRYKLMHFYDDIDAWEFYDLKTDPSEIHNKIDDPAYADVILRLHKQLDSIQNVYGVTQKEFEQAPKERVAKEYQNFRRLRGTPMK